jgi:protein required for attachment to host cells
MAGNEGTIWILIADGAHARVVVPAPRRQFRTINSFDSAMAHLPAEGAPAGHPGRGTEGGPAARHAIEPRGDPRRAAKREFLHYVAAQMNAAAASGQFDHLVLVAPVAALGMLREALEAPTASRVSGALAKDIVKVAESELSEHLLAFWRPPAERP